MSEPSPTPMMQQYRELKARDPDALLLFRMGDFYEMFGEDAERGAALLGLALTTRDKGPNAVPMAGFPHPALESYLAKLVQAGQRAAVCEQVEDPKLAKGLVQPRGRPGRHAGHADRRRAARPEDGQLPGRRRRGRRQARPGLGRALDRPVLADGRLADRAGRRDRPAQPGRGAGLGDQPRRPLGPHAAGPAGAGGHGAAVVGLPARAGADDALPALRHDHPGRLRRRRPRPRGPGRRGPGGLPPRDAEDLDRPPDPPDPLPTRRHPGARRDDPPQPRADADPPRRQARRLACSR